jgi:tetratricopeptide (TPR) repeat protein
MSTKIMASVVIGSSLIVIACAPTNPKIGTTEITSSAILASYQESEAAAEDLVKGRWVDALARAERASLLAPENAWARYDHAVALHELGRTDAAVVEFREAEAGFTNSDRHGKALSIYGRARALDDVGRCDEARAAYGDFARFTSSFDPSASKVALAYAEECRPSEPVIGDGAMTDLVTAVITHNYQNALDASQHVNKPARSSGWLDYNRAIALAGLGRTDDAVAAYRAAEDRFGRAEPKNQAIAVYGRARAFDQANRCADATRAYEEYADLVRASSPVDAQMAEKFANACGR